MLDPLLPKCHICFEEFDKHGIPIPDCTPCKYPEMTLLAENYEAWEMWIEMQGQLTNLSPAGSSPYFALNLHSFVLMCRIKKVRDVEETWEKVKLIFETWQKIRERGSATQRSLDAATSMQRAPRGR